MTEEKTAPSSAEQSPVSPGRRAFVKKAYLAPTVILLELGSIHNASAQSMCCPDGLMGEVCREQHPLWPPCPP